MKHNAYFLIVLLFGLSQLQASTYEEAKGGLAALEKLKSDRLITDAEYTKRREEIIKSVDGKSDNQILADPTTAYQKNIRRVLASVHAVLQEIRKENPDVFKDENDPYFALGLIANNRFQKNAFRTGTAGFKAIDLTGCPDDFVTAYRDAAQKFAEYGRSLMDVSQGISERNVSGATSATPESPKEAAAGKAMTTSSEAMGTAMADLGAITRKYGVNAPSELSLPGKNAGAVPP